MANQIYFTVATLLVTPDRECLIFNDGHGEVQDPLRDFEGDSTRPHYVYSKEQLQRARNFLNSPEVVRVLEQE